MMRTRANTLAVTGLFLALISLRSIASEKTVAAAFTQFLTARTPQDAAKAADAVAKSGVDFEAALQRLKEGRVYSADVPKGIVRHSHAIGGTDFPYTLDVPESYTPAKRYQIRIQLHGGVGRPDALPRNGIGQLAGAEQIYILPTAWAGFEWWTARQLENLHWIVDSVKRTYNVDESHIVVSGVSDGGTGAYYVAMRETTLFASFLPLNGALAVLRNPSMKIDGPLFPQNFVNKPFFIVNGGRDPLYPTAVVEPYIEHMARGGVEVKYLPQPEAGHNTQWWPQLKDTFETFVSEHPRQPYPDRLTWETTVADAANRAHWLVIDKLAPGAPNADDATLPDLNRFGSGPMPDFGLRVSGARVTSIAENSNASIFGFERGDVIVSINGGAVPPDANALEALSHYPGGKMTTIAVSRNGAAVELTGMLLVTGPPRVRPLFNHGSPSGRVDLTKEGNVVRATTRGVEAFTLLLSPDSFDFSKPVTVIANGTTVFDGRVTKSVATLMKWAARDNDRTMLFGAELPIKLRPRVAENPRVRVAPAGSADTSR
jgi:poly(3-hydroxybutyrate) depolymerase